MFLMNKSNKIKYRDSIKEAAENLNNGKMDCLTILYQALITDDSLSISIASNAISNRLGNMNYSQIIKLEEEFRQHTSMEWYIDWNSVSLDIIKKNIINRETYLNVIRLGTFHPNGYFREKCIKELGMDSESLPYLVLRLNDWVNPIRDNTYSLITTAVENAGFESLVNILPFLAKVKRGGRRDTEQIIEIEDRIEKRIKQKIISVKMIQILKYDLLVRRYLYIILSTDQILPKEHLGYLLNKEKSGYHKLILFNGILKNYDCSMNEIDLYLENKSTVVRRRALDYKYALLKSSWHGIEKMLLDCAKGIRETVCYIVCQNTDFDIVNYYISHLQSDFLPISLLGIGENGSEIHAGIIKKYLTSKDEKIVRNSIKAVRMLLGIKGADIYWEYLADSRTTVAKSALIAMNTFGIKYGAKQVYDRYLLCNCEYTKRCLIVQIINEASWDRLPYLLLLYHYGDLQIRDMIRKKINQRNIYGKVSIEVSNYIKNILKDEKLELPKKLTAEIEFDLKYVTQ